MAEVCPDARKEGSVLEEVKRETVAGRLKHFVHEWMQLMSDKHTQDLVQHAHIPFNDARRLMVTNNLTSYIMSEEDIIVDEELEKLKTKGVIVKLAAENVRYLSNIILRPKKNG